MRPGRPSAKSRGSSTDDVCRARPFLPPRPGATAPTARSPNSNENDPGGPPSAGQPSPGVLDRAWSRARRVRVLPLIADRETQGGRGQPHRLSVMCICSQIKCASLVPWGINYHDGDWLLVIRASTTRRSGSGSDDQAPITRARSGSGAAALGAALESGDIDELPGIPGVRESVHRFRNERFLTESNQCSAHLGFVARHSASDDSTGGVEYHVLTPAGLKKCQTLRSAPREDCINRRRPILLKM